MASKSQLIVTSVLAGAISFVISYSTNTPYAQPLPQPAEPLYVPTLSVKPVYPAMAKIAEFTPAAVPEKQVLSETDNSAEQPKQEQPTPDKPQPQQQHSSQPDMLSALLRSAQSLLQP